MSEKQIVITVAAFAVGILYGINIHAWYDDWQRKRWAEWKKIRHTILPTPPRRKTEGGVE